MASPDHDVSRRGGDVGPHRHLEDQTDHLLFFCHLSSPVAKHYSHASWSLRIPCGICYSAPNICSSNYCGIGGSHRVASANSPACKGKSLRCLRKCRSSYIDTSPALVALRPLTAALLYPARPPQRLSRSHLGCQTHQTYFFAHLQSRPRRGSPVARTRFKLIYLKRFGAGASLAALAPA